MSNLKQIGLGMMQYTQDYDERYPVAFVSRTVKFAYNDFTSEQLTWADRIYPYINSLQVFQCPSQTISPNGGTAPAMSHVVTPYAYQYNQHKAETAPAEAVGDTGFGVSTTVGVSLAAVEVPAETILLYDGWGRMETGGYNAGDLASLINGVTPSAPSSINLTNSIKIARRHLNGLNVLFADGHVKWKNKSKAGEWTLTGAD